MPVPEIVTKEERSKQFQEPYNAQLGVFSQVLVRWIEMYGDDGKVSAYIRQATQGNSNSGSENQPLNYIQIIRKQERFTEAIGDFVKERPKLEKLLTPLMKIGIRQNETESGFGLIAQLRERVTQLMPQLPEGSESTPDAKTLISAIKNEEEKTEKDGKHFLVVKTNTLSEAYMVGFLREVIALAPDQRIKKEVGDAAEQTPESPFDKLSDMHFTSCKIPGIRFKRAADNGLYIAIRQDIVADFLKIPVAPPEKAALVITAATVPATSETADQPVVK